MSTPARPVLLALVLLALPFAFVARAAPGADPGAAQAAGVARWVDAEATAGGTATGSDLFDLEWAFGTWQMAALGFAQRAESVPAARADALLQLDASLELVTAAPGRAFDADQWGTDPLDALDGDRGHIAWLGYTNLTLSARRALGPHPRWDVLNDTLSAAIVRRLEHELMPETYPGERYPVDVSAAVASVGEWARVTGRPEPAVLARWRAAVRERWVVGGVLVQSLDAELRASDRPRGSGTFLASWFLSRWDPAFAAELYRGGRDRLLVEMGPLAAMREYPAGTPGGGDIDSGPIVGGMGVSATGFAIGAGLAAGDTTTAARLRATAELVGQARTEAGELHWAAGSALGSAPLADAILFAMFTTPARAP